MEKKPSINRRVVLTWVGVLLLSEPVFVMLGSDPKLGLLSGISIALGSALVVLGNIRT